MAIVQTVDLPQLRDPKIAEKIRKSVQDMSDQQTMKEGYVAKIKESIAAVSEEHDVPKKVIRQMLATYHAQTFAAKVEESEVFQDAYTKVFGDD